MKIIKEILGLKIVRYFEDIKWLERILKPRNIYWYSSIISKFIG